MPYTRKELFKALDIDPGTQAETSGAKMILRVLHERAGAFAAEYRNRSYIQKLRKAFGKGFDAKLERATEKAFVKIRKNQEWAFIFQSLDDNCPMAFKVHIQMLWSARTLSIVFEQLEKEAERG